MIFNAQQGQALPKLAQSSEYNFGKKGLCFAAPLTTCHYQNDLLLSPMNYDDFFSEFPPVSKEDWLRQVAKDLKGKPLDELTWQTADGLSVSPFAHADDFQVPPQPLATEPNRWEICELLHVADSLAPVGAGAGLLFRLLLRHGFILRDMSG